MEEDIKKYCFTRQYKEGLIPSREEKIKVLKKNIRQQFLEFEEKVKQLKKQDDLSCKVKGTIEMAGELIESLKVNYGENFQKLDSLSDKKIEDLYHMIRHFIRELEKLETEQQKESSEHELK